MERQQKQIALFIEGSSFFHIQRNELQWWIDPRRLLEWAKLKGEVVEARYFGAYNPDDGNQQRFISALSYMGYSKDVTELRDNSASLIKVNMVTDMFTTNFDTLYLVSGDQDFAKPCQVLRNRGKEVKVLSSGRYISREIRDTVGGTQIIDLQSIRNEIEKP